MTYFYQYNYPV